METSHVEVGRNDGSVQPKSCHACGASLLGDTPFCSTCGVKQHTNPNNADLSALIARVSRLEEELEKDSHSHDWNWWRLDEAEKWKVWWGVFWRGLVAYLGVMIVILAFANSR